MMTFISYLRKKFAKSINIKHETMILSRTTDKLVIPFMTEDYSEALSSVIVYNKPTLCSPLSFLHLRMELVFL